ncbi:hypothetical protein [uncultured Psychroserpens sp.]|uniref:hypothetical protein n=1 Tax=uncultured Psychroserpens sp. TaxID=255436 RepID=UPI00262AA394|nr:hypothetical protein [uncultured Psychroserpens sp.]
MESKDYLKDISEIKTMMNKSSRFLSISGLSGILAGIYALIGAYFGYNIIYANNIVTIDGYRTLIITEDGLTNIFIVAMTVVVMSIVTGIILSYLKAKKQSESMWDSTSKRLIINFMIPLVTGGTFIMLLLEKDAYPFIAPLTMIFYGLACVNASKYTLGYIRYLGLTMIVIGLISTYFLGYGLFFWALGFGVCHIFYGTIMHFKYDRLK